MEHSPDCAIVSRSAGVLCSRWKNHSLDSAVGFGRNGRHPASGSYQSASKAHSISNNIPVGPVVGNAGRRCGADEASKGMASQGAFKPIQRSLLMYLKSMVGTKPQSSKGRKSMTRSRRRKSVNKREDPDEQFGREILVFTGSTVEWRKIKCTKEMKVERYTIDKSPKMLQSMKRCVHNCPTDDR